MSKAQYAIIRLGDGTYALAIIDETGIAWFVNKDTGELELEPRGDYEKVDLRSDATEPQ